MFIDGLSASEHRDYNRKSVEVFVLPISASFPVMDQLNAWGPNGSDCSSPQDAIQYCRDLAVRHAENFSVLSRFVPDHLVDGIAALYAFCRWCDDLADETGDPQRSLELLGWWRTELHDCFSGRARHPVFVALRTAIVEYGLDDQPFHDLLDAFEGDQHRNRYAAWSDLTDYARGSANPVGRIVLSMAGEPCTDAQLAASDALCTALQLTNLWQDVRRDLGERNRIYLPGDLHDIPDFESRLQRTVRDGRAPDPDFLELYRDLVRDCVNRTLPLYEQGHRLLAMTSAELRPMLWLFHAGGFAVLRAIRSCNHETCLMRPRLGLVAKGILLLRARRRAGGAT